MSFSRAPVKRFNDSTERSIPRPGAYTPKVGTGVGMGPGSRTPSSSKISVGRTQSRSRVRPGHSDSNERDDTFSNNSSNARLSREPSFAEIGRRSFTYTVSSDRPSTVDVYSNKSKFPGGKKFTLIPTPTKRSTSNPRNRNIRSVSNPRIMRPSTSPSSNSSATPLKAIYPIPLPYRQSPERNRIEDVTEVGLYQRKTSDQNLEYEVSGGMNSLTVIGCESVFGEIQNMAQNLQVEATEYKRRLSEEVISRNELKMKNIELEFEVQALKRELKKQDQGSSSPAGSSSSLYSSRSRSGLKTQTQLEKELSALKQEFRTREGNLLERINWLEEKNKNWNEKRVEFEGTLQKLHEALKEEETRRNLAEEKCKLIETQVDTNCRVCGTKLEANPTAGSETVNNLKKDESLQESGNMSNDNVAICQPEMQILNSQNNNVLQNDELIRELETKQIIRELV